MGGVAVQAGPALQTLNNITNTAEFTINNTYGQSFSVDGIVNASFTPFATGNAIDLDGFTTGSAIVTTGFLNGDQESFKAVSQISVSVEENGNKLPLILDHTSMAGITLVAGTGTVTMGASISSTLFGPSTVKATSSFTNQLINDLSAF